MGLLSGGGCVTGHNECAERQDDCVGIVPSGDERFYVKVVRNFMEGTARYELFERGAGDRVVSAVWPPESIMEADPARRETLRTRVGREVAHGEFPTPPERLAVLNDGKGFVFVPEVMTTLKEDALVFVAGSGKCTWRVALRTLFSPGEEEEFDYTVHGLHWCEDMRVDESSREVVVSARGRVVRKVSLVDGKIARER